MRVWALSSLPSWKKTPEAWSSGQLVECLPPASAPVLRLLGLVTLCLSCTYSWCFIHVMSVGFHCSTQDHCALVCSGSSVNACLSQFRTSRLLLLPPLLSCAGSSCSPPPAVGEPRLHICSFICTQSSPCILLGPSVCGDPQICVTRPDLWMPCFSMADLMPL